jgi:hypothetical protein
MGRFPVQLGALDAGFGAAAPSPFWPTRGLDRTQITAACLDIPAVLT